MKETTLEDDISIDLNDLRGEIQKQPTLYNKWGKKYARARAISFKKQEELKLIKSEAKAMVEEEKARLDSDIRINFSEYDFDKKPTETAIASTIINQKSYKLKLEKQSEMIRVAIDEAAEAIEAEEAYDTAKTAMQHKKFSLEKESSLFISEFYCEPKIDKAYREIDKEMSGYTAKTMQKRKQLKEEKKD